MVELVWPSSKAFKQKRTLVQFCFSSLFSFEKMSFMDSVLWLLPLTVNEALKQLCLLPILMQNYSGGDTDSIVLGIISLLPHLLGSWSSPVPFQRQLLLKSFNQPANYGVLLLEDVPVRHWNGHAQWIRGWCWCICWSCCLISWCRLRIAVGSRLRIVVGSHQCKSMQVLSLKKLFFFKKNILLIVIPNIWA